MKLPLAIFHGDRNSIAAYVRTHIAGSTAGVRLFEHSGRHQLDREVGAIVLEIAEQLFEERDYLCDLADRLGPGENPIFSTLAALGEKVSRLKPTDLFRRTETTDLADLEAMRIALSGKLAGWDSMLAVVDEYDELDRAVLEGYRDQALQQRERITDAHRLVAKRALGR